ncbi:uncharacterized protein [Panulirus ornatus]
MIQPDNVIEAPCCCPQPSWGELSAEDYITVVEGRMETMHAWLDSGGDINSVMRLGYTFLHAACAGGQVDVVDELLKHDDLHLNIKNQWGRTPLMVACRRGKEACVEKLIFAKHKCKIDLTVKDDKGHTALALAAQEKHWEILRLLVTQDVLYDEDSLDIALFKTVESSQWKYAEYLLRHHQGFEEETISMAVEKASADNNVKVMRLLLEKYIFSCHYETLSTARASANQAGHDDIERLLVMSLNKYKFAYPEDDKTQGRIVPKRRESDGRALNSTANVVRRQMMPLSIYVRPARIPVPPSPDVYDTTTTPRGLVLILNYNQFYGHSEMQREGSNLDVLNLQNLCSQMGYETQVHINLTRGQTLAAVNNFRNEERLGNVGCAIVTIMSHGVDRHTFKTSDLREVTVLEIQSLFLNHECPPLKGKPKIFLLNFCRGSEIPATYETDAVKEQPKDMICIYSTTENFLSYRDSQRGCPFITTLCDVIGNHAHEMDLDSLIRKFQLKYLPKTTPEVQNLGFRKKFYFNPVGTAYTSG